MHKMIEYCEVAEVAGAGRHQMLRARRLAEADAGAAPGGGGGDKRRRLEGVEGSAGGRYQRHRRRQWRRQMRRRRRPEVGLLGHSRGSEMYSFGVMLAEALLESDSIRAAPGEQAGPLDLLSQPEVAAQFDAEQRVVLARLLAADRA